MSHLPKSTQRRIMAAIAEKLSARPEIFGKPLRHALRQYYALRVGDYRVLYMLKEETVYVILVGHRKDVYQDAMRRILRVS